MDENRTSEIPVDAGTRVKNRIGLAVLCLPALLASLELTVTNLALPAIAAAFEATSLQLLWTVDIYGFLLAGSLITMGALGDRFGRRRILIIGAALYGLASLAAAFASTIEVLIVARACMGVAGATLMPSTLALAAALFPQPRQRAVAIGIIIASVSAGTAIGPLVGGWLLEKFWWGSAFFLAVPIMAVLLVLVPVFVPEHRSAGESRIDLFSAGVSIGSVLLVVLGLKLVATEGIHLGAAAAVVAGLLLGTFFVWMQRRSPIPFLEVSLFRHRLLSIAAATLAAGIFVLWGFNWAFAQYLQLVRGLDPLEAGLWTAPSAAGVIVGSMLAPRMARRIGQVRVVAIGLSISSIGYFALSAVQTTTDLAWIVAGTVIVSAGLGPMMAIATDLVIGAAPEQRAGAAASIATTAPQLGGALGIAALGSVVSAVYRTTVDGADLSAVPEALRTALRDNLGTATAVSAASPALDPADALELGRAAFTLGFSVMSVICAVVMVAVTVLLLLTDRRRWR